MIGETHEGVGSRVLGRMGLNNWQTHTAKKTTPDPVTLEAPIGRDRD